MKKEEVHWADWHRILLGTAPEQFLLEVLIRTVIMYLVLLVTLRLLGKRMGGQLDTSDLAIMLTLGAIVSVPMQIPERGLLQGLLVLVCALAFEKGINYLSVKNHYIEQLLQGRERLLVKNGVMVIDELNAMKISREQMMAQLRNKKIYNLGAVQRVYIEASGLFSIYKYAVPNPGLALLPPEDGEASTELTVNEDLMVCWQCGNPAANLKETTQPCNNCGANKWTLSVINK